MFFTVLAWDKPDCGVLRAGTKARHRKFLDEADPALRVLQSGPLLSEAGEEQGSLIVVEAEEKATVDRFVRRDPYAAAGLFRSIEVHAWLWRRGNPYLPPEAPGAAGPGGA